MSRVINEQLERELRLRIPSMARNIHEGILGAIKSAASGIANAGIEFAKGEYKKAAALNLERDKRLRDNVLADLHANRLDISKKELIRLRDEVPDAHPTRPERMIDDPNHAGPGPAPRIPNPKFSDEMDKYLVAKDDWHAKQKMKAAVAGINATDRNIGRFAETLQGKPGTSRIGTIQRLKRSI